MSVKLISIKDTKPSTIGCWSQIEYHREEWYSGDKRPRQVTENVQINLTDKDVLINKLGWGGFSKEIIFQQDLSSFIELLSGHPRFLRTPPPTLLEAVTEIALTSKSMSDFISSLKIHLRSVKRMNKNDGNKKNEANTLSMETSLFLHTIDHKNGSAKTLLELLEKENIATNDIPTQKKVAFEFFFLFLYLLESTLQTKLGQIKGRELADKVLEVALESLSKNSDFEQETFKASLLDDYMERMKTYSQFPDFIAEKPAGTLFWEFGKTVANILGKGQHIYIVILVQTLCTDFLININEVKLPN